MVLVFTARVLLSLRLFVHYVSLRMSVHGLAERPP